MTAACSKPGPDPGSQRKVLRSSSFGSTFSPPVADEYDEVGGLAQIPSCKNFCQISSAARCPVSERQNEVQWADMDLGKSYASGVSSPSQPGRPSGATEKASFNAKSKSTAVLLHEGLAEWWVVTNHDTQISKLSKAEGSNSDGGSIPREPSFVHSVSSGTLPSSSERPPGPRPTWCGASPGAQTGDFKPTKWEQGMFGMLRRKCSVQRNRYELGGYDLDLTYVTSKVIAMGFPAAGMEALFRNPRSTVARFLRQEHEGRFRIYNLCKEESHWENGFPEQTVRYPCADHCPPSLKILADFCLDARDWLLRCEDNIAVVHCKAGKGRTGTMIAALLVYARSFPSAYEALVWYEWMRGGKRSGVTIPDQIKWVAMLERWLRHGCVQLASDPMGAPVPHRLLSVRIGPFPGYFLRPPGSCGSAQGDGTCDVTVTLVSRTDVERQVKVTYRYPEVVVRAGISGVIEVVLPDSCVWTDSDGLLVIHVVPRTNNVLPARKKGKTVRVWWHHAFLHRQERARPASTSSGESTVAGSDPLLAESQEQVLELKVPKAWVCGMHKDLEEHRKAPADFQLNALFQDVHGAGSMQQPLDPHAEAIRRVRVAAPEDAII